MKRDQALDQVKQLTMGDRNQTHGDPVQQFEKAQRIKDAVGHQTNPELTPAEVECIEMICTKLSRWTSGKRSQTTAAKYADHPLDIIGYAAIAVEAIYATEPEESFEEMQRRINSAPAVEAPYSEFAGPGQIAKRFAPGSRKVQDNLG